MNLIQEILGAQGGGVVKQLGQQFGLDNAQVEKALTNLIPAIAGGVKKTAQSPSSLDALLKTLQQNKGLETAVQRPEVLANETSQQAGNDILGEIFGSKDVSRTVASQTAQSTEIDLSALKKMLPLIAELVMSSLNQKGQASSGGLGELLGGLAQSSTPTSSSGGLGSLLGSLLGGRTKQAPAKEQGLESLLDFDGDGNISDDVMDLVKKLF